MCFSVYAMERPTRGVDDDVWQRRPAVALGHSTSRPFAARAVLALAVSGENGQGHLSDGCYAARVMGCNALARPPETFASSDAKFPCTSSDRITISGLQSAVMESQHASPSRSPNPCSNIGEKRR